MRLRPSAGAGRRVLRRSRKAPSSRQAQPCEPPDRLCPPCAWSADHQQQPSECRTERQWAVADEDDPHLTLCADRWGCRIRPFDRRAVPEYWRVGYARQRLSIDRRARLRAGGTFAEPSVETLFYWQRKEECEPEHCNDDSGHEDPGPSGEEPPHADVHHGHENAQDHSSVQRQQRWHY